MAKKQETKNGERDETPSAPSEMGLATVSEVLSFGKSSRTKMIMIAGVFCALIAGAVGPVMIWYFAESYQELVADPTTDQFMDEVRRLAYTFLVLGVVAFASLSAYSAFLQTAAGTMTIDLKTKWYQALLRQDLAYFDIQDVSGTATVISTSAAKYERGVGKKLGLFVQFNATFAGGLIYAFYSSWQTSLMVLLTVPFMAVSGWFLVKLTTKQSQRANSSYAEAGSVVYNTVTSIRTILSLNGAHCMIEKFESGTSKAYEDAVAEVHLLGLGNGSMMSSFLLSSIAVPLYGGYLLYDQVRGNGCDPSGAVQDVPTCHPSGVKVFGAMFGIFFAASVLPQITTSMEAFTEARAACYLALQVMNRKLEGGTGGAATDNELEISTTLRRQGANTNAINTLPKYAIDSSSPTGVRPANVKGNIAFNGVTFAYPTRIEYKVFEDFSLQIKAGQTVALVGSTGSGKSTVAQLLERFYDPNEGSICLDGEDLRNLNVAWLRENIGLVSQEPALFATSIRENIAYGLAEVTMEQIIEAARIANAHDFISVFPDGYDTQVGDKGTKLSGGQKQRIAIARTIIKNPKILVFDEATSALDSESERVVQTAIDNLLGASGRTTIVIAHRLSTIRNADVVAVLDRGMLVEMGSHDALIAKKGVYHSLAEAQSKAAVSTCDKSSSVSKQSSVVSSGSSIDGDADSKDASTLPVLRFRDVKFTYPSRLEAEVLRDFNLSVRNGETLALVGPSGSGKSTVFQLIERFYDPDIGSIEFDGVNLKCCKPHLLRSQIGLVSQEPSLFDLSIAENIRFGLKDVTDEQVMQAAQDANAHDFIMTFPDGYDTQVGEGGAQVSGGQKQRICIARVLLRHPRLMLLDEATSALDGQSERLVQTALDKVMTEENQTTLVIAHRLSTIRNADRIAVIVHGRIVEIGSYDTLMANEHGSFRRLQAYQNMDDCPDLHDTNDTSGAPPAVALKKRIEDMRSSQRREQAKQEEEEELKAIDKSREKRNANKARQLSKGDEVLLFLGAFGALLVGAIFPAWGYVFAYSVKLLYTPVEACDAVNEPVACQEYWDSEADAMEKLSHSIAYGAAGTIGASMIGYLCLFVGFGTATERMNKRVRDLVYTSLIRQEVAFFDTHPAGKLTSQLQDDAALIHSFSGEPIRTLVINVSSVLVGLIIGFVYMWPFALVFLGILPFLGFGAEMEMKMYYAPEDEGDDSLPEDEHSPGGIVVESLLNIRTVASLTLEKTKLEEYHHALWRENPRPLFHNFLKGSGFGLGQFFQMWGIALMFWFGGWLLHTQDYEFDDFVISMFGLFFSLYGLTVALEGATDRKKAKLAADRIFSLMDRETKIDPLAVEVDESSVNQKREPGTQELAGKDIHVRTDTIEEISPPE